MSEPPLLVARSFRDGDQFSVSPEASLNDAFLTQSEKILCDAYRSAAVLITPTCSLEKNSTWTFSPIQLLSGEPDMARSTLFATPGYLGFFGLPRNGSFVEEDAFVDFSFTVSVPRDHSPLNSRVLSLGREASLRLGTKLANFFGRDWGYAENERVEEDGFYRCRLCAMTYSVPVDEVALKKGDKAPKCAQCQSRGRRESWAKLLQPKQKNLPFPPKTIRPGP